MSFFKPSGVNETPYIEIVRWKIYRVISELWPEETIHLSGYNLTEHHGRTSSAIVKIDKENMILTTESGRAYKLVGEPGFDPDASYVWGMWCLRNQVKEWFDASKEAFE